VYLVTVQHVFELTRSGFIQLADLSGTHRYGRRVFLNHASCAPSHPLAWAGAKLGELAQVACGNKSLLISGSTTLTVVSLPAGDLVTKSLSNVSNILDLQYDAGSGSLIALANYKLFHLDIVTCDATFLLDIPGRYRALSVSYLCCHGCHHVFDMQGLCYVSCHAVFAAQMGMVIQASARCLVPRFCLPTSSMCFLWTFLLRALNRRSILTATFAMETFSL